MPDTVKLNIRNPCLDEARDIEAPLDWTVLQVKEDVERDWPEHPRPADQRLIYSGKLLEDTSKLQDVLRLEEGWASHTIHLVCRQLSAKASARASKTAGEVRKRNTAPYLAPTSSDSNYWQAYMQAAAQGHQPSHDTQHQMMMHQMYAHYFQQYMHYVNSSWNQGTGQPEHQMPQQLPVAAAAAAAAAMMGQQHTAPVSAVADQPAPPQAAPQDPAPAVAQGPGGDGNLGNAVMNAGAGAMGAMEDDDEFEGGQRDLLDWFYVASRVIVLFSIVYFYSSFARFALVMGLGLILYLYSVGVFGNPNVDPEPQAAPAAPAPAPAPNDDNSDSEATNAPEGPSIPEAPREPQQPWHAVATTFVTTFFTSLMPNQPQAV